MIKYERDIIDYMNIPNIPKKEWNGVDSFKDGVAVVDFTLGSQGYAVCTFDKDKDVKPRIKKVFGQELFSEISKVFIVPSYMDMDIKDADLDSESKKRAEQLAEEAEALENEGTVDDAVKNADKLPEWIFPEIHDAEQARAYMREYNRANGIKKGKVPSNEETLKMRLYAIYMENKKRNK